MAIPMVEFDVTTWLRHREDLVASLDGLLEVPTDPFFSSKKLTHVVRG